MNDQQPVSDHSAAGNAQRGFNSGRILEVIERNKQPVGLEEVQDGQCAKALDGAQTLFVERLKAVNPVRM
jgi:hypothetical protein